MRGKTYAFANSQRLQRKLAELGIRYLHCKDLAPDPAMRALQDGEDVLRKETKRARTRLGANFIETYRQTYLADFDAMQFLDRLGQEARVICLFCVEREPEACHRSLLASRLADDLQLPLEHIIP